MISNEKLTVIVTVVTGAPVDFFYNKKGRAEATICTDKGNFKATGKDAEYLVTYLKTGNTITLCVNDKNEIVFCNLVTVKKEVKDYLFEAGIREV